MKIKLLTLSSAITEAVTLAQIREQLVIEHNDDLKLLARLSATARDIVERHIDGAVVDKNYEVKMDCFSASIEIPIWPIDPSSVAVTYLDANQVSQPFTSFDVDSARYSSTISPSAGSSWPQTANVRDAVTITFTAGFVATEGEIPLAITHAILMTIATIEETRKNHSVGVELKEVPSSAMFFLEPFMRKVV